MTNNSSTLRDMSILKDYHIFSHMILPPLLRYHAREATPSYIINSMFSETALLEHMAAMKSGITKMGGLSVYAFKVLERNGEELALSSNLLFLEIVLLSCFFWFIQSFYIV